MRIRYRMQPLQLWQRSMIRFRACCTSLYSFALSQTTVFGGKMRATDAVEIIAEHNNKCSITAIASADAAATT